MAIAKRNRPDSEDRFDFAEKMEKRGLKAQAVTFAGNARGFARMLLLPFQSVIAVFVVMCDGEKFRRQEGVTNREKKYHGCHEVERLSSCATYKPLP